MVTPYATGQEFLARYDWRLVGDLIRDDSTQDSLANLPTNANLLAALEDAYSEIIGTALVGNRYTIDQLDPANLSEMAQIWLRRLNIDMALALVKKRRGKWDEKNDKPLWDSILERLKSLKDGSVYLIASTEDHAAASTLGLGQPELIPIAKRQTIRFLTRGYFPNYPYNGHQQNLGNHGD